MCGEGRDDVRRLSHGKHRACASQRNEKKMYKVDYKGSTNNVGRHSREKVGPEESILRKKNYSATSTGAD